MEKWISVKDRLPEDNSEVLLYIPYSRYSKIRNDVINGYEDFDYGRRLKVTENDFILTDEVDFFDKDECATHWMILPEPPA